MVNVTYYETSSHQLLSVDIQPSFTKTMQYILSFGLISFLRHLINYFSMYGTFNEK